MMNQLLEAIESVKRIESNPFFTLADRHLAHILLEDAAQALHEQVLRYVSLIGIV